MSEYSYNTIPTPVENQAATYRCKVIGNSEAQMHVGRRWWKVQVRETSGNGFTLGLPRSLAKKISSGYRYELRYDDRRIQLLTEDFIDSENGEARLHVVILREYEPKERWAFRLPFCRGSRVISQDSAMNSSAAYGGFVLVLFCVMSLPGIGDQLGTAPRIENAVKIMGEKITYAIRAIRQ
ncbi:hypothetical protein NHH03_01870 [Stieleria sp. TO1_6]|uniref:hypothetical protein n=1 Tax=Stieleria tagensis TaxID=2956795 RepID=UPI00209BAB13|nr:hypothetical protein [Stieleria tagensis]MCO8120468.1 hypothetical protein [Stieleria tagensis]